MAFILLFQEFAASVAIASGEHKPILLAYDPSLTLIGTGRSAYVFKLPQSNKALKVFFPAYSHLAKEEAEIYQILKHIAYYPTLYEAGSNYLVIDYIEGSTLFNCITKGIVISDDTIKEIDKALQLARQEGLNPSDIHLRNIFLTLDKEVRIIDVARFRQTKACIQWRDLKYAFYHYYKKRYFPQKIPASMLDILGVLYKKNLIRLNGATNVK